MFDKSFQTLNLTKRRITPSKEHSVRVLRASPQDVTLQIRDKFQFMGVSLTFEEAKEIGRALIDATETKINTAA